MIYFLALFFVLCPSSNAEYLCDSYENGVLKIKTYHEVCKYYSWYPYEPDISQFVKYIDKISMTHIDNKLYECEVAMRSLTASYWLTLGITMYLIDNIFEASHGMRMTEYTVRAFRTYEALKEAKMAAEELKKGDRGNKEIIERGIKYLPNKVTVTKPTATTAVPTSTVPDSSDREKNIADALEEASSLDDEKQAFIAKEIGTALCQSVYYACSDNVTDETRNQCMKEFMRCIKEWAESCPRLATDEERQKCSVYAKGKGLGLVNLPDGFLTEDFVENEKHQKALSSCLPSFGACQALAEVNQKQECVNLVLEGCTRGWEETCSTTEDEELKECEEQNKWKLLKNFVNSYNWTRMSPPPKKLADDTSYDEVVDIEGLQKRCKDHEESGITADEYCRDACGLAYLAGEQIEDVCSQFMQSSCVKSFEYHCCGKSTNAKWVRRCGRHLGREWFKVFCDYLWMVGKRDANYCPIPDNLEAESDV